MFLKNSLTLETLKKYQNPIFFETGTFKGHAIELALQCDFEKIYSVEIDSFLTHEAKEKFHEEILSGRVEIIYGDTAVLFETLISKLDKPTTFWLDDHWSGGNLIGKVKCPLPIELEALKNHPIKNHTLMIDDTRMFGSYWGHGLSKEGILEQVMAINPNYEIFYEDGIEPRDIWVAVAKEPVVLTFTEQYEQGLHLL